MAESRKKTPKVNTRAKLEKVQFATLTEVQEKIGLGYFWEKKFKFDIEDKIMEKTFGKKVVVQKKIINQWET